jgi:hypothetical protein
VQGIQEQRQISAPQLAGAVRVADLDGLQLLKQQTP